MTKYYKKLAAALAVVTVLSFGAVFGVLDVLAQEEGLAKKIRGSWVLVSNINEQDGQKSDLFGPDPRGFMVLSPEGRFSIIMMRASLPKIASGNRLTATAEENKAVTQGSFATFGTYRVVSEKDRTVSFNYEGCTFPNWDGKDMQRTMTVSGDEMKQIVPGAAIGGTNYAIWRRVK